MAHHLPSRSLKRNRKSGSFRDESGALSAQCDTESDDEELEETTSQGRSVSSLRPMLDIVRYCSAQVHSYNEWVVDYVARAADRLAGMGHLWVLRIALF